MITSLGSATGQLVCSRIVLLLDGRKLGVQTRERSFECGQGWRNLIQFACLAELLQLKGCVDGGARAEVGNGAF